MTDEAVPPYTGKKSEPAKPAAKKAAPVKKAAPTAKAAPVAEEIPAPAASASPVPVGYAPVVPGATLWSVVWHSRAVLIGVAGFAALCAVATFIGGLGFPGGPIEGIYWIGMIVGLLAVAVAVGALTVVEFTRRGTPGRLAMPVNPRPSVFAIVGLVLSALALAAWATTGGLEQVFLQDRYMYATGALFFIGIPWALGGIFGAWGYRPGGSRVTNVLAIIAIAAWAVPALFTTYAAVIYGLGLTD
ncbi:MAG: hypothetical protein ABI566_06145 [Pseudolysinimonas sp.]